MRSKRFRRSNAANLSAIVMLATEHSTTATTATTLSLYNPTKRPIAQHPIRQRRQRQACDKSAANGSVVDDADDHDDDNDDYSDEGKLDRCLLPGTSLILFLCGLLRRRGRRCCR